MLARFELSLLGVFLALGLASGGFFISKTMYNSKVAINTATVKGLAERRVEADLAKWYINYSLAANSKEAVPNLYKRAEADQAAIISVLKESGFSDEEIQPGIIDYSFQEFRDRNQKLVDQKHILRGTVGIETSKVRSISAARAQINELIAKGINIQNELPSYRFTKLNQIKPEMLKEAARSARLAASEFAENAGVQVGSIQTARQGSFVISDAGGAYESNRKIEKDVRVVTTISFYLTD